MELWFNVGEVALALGILGQSWFLGKLEFAVRVIRDAMAREIKTKFHEQYQRISSGHVCSPVVC